MDDVDLRLTLGLLKILEMHSDFKTLEDKKIADDPDLENRAKKRKLRAERDKRYRIQ